LATPDDALKSTWVNIHQGLFALYGPAMAAEAQSAVKAENRIRYFLKDMFFSIVAVLGFENGKRNAEKERALCALFFSEGPPPFL
jgi:hypothetical protein